MSDSVAGPARVGRKESLAPGFSGGEYFLPAGLCRVRSIAEGQPANAEHVVPAVQVILLVLYRWLEDMATHSRIPAWKVLWTEEPAKLQSMGSQGAGHD